MRLKTQAVMISSLLLSCLLAPSVANAASVSFETFDVNRDGIIDRDEWLNSAAREYQVLDANRDGNVSYNEYHRQGQGNRYGGRNKRRQPRFEDLDLNHDGILSRNEWPGDAVDYFAALDANRDGNVTYNEFFNRGGVSTTVLRGLDADNDQRISQGEWTGSAAEFNGIDVDQNGFITVPELSASSTAAAQPTATAASSSEGSSIEEIFLKLLQK